MTLFGIGVGKWTITAEKPHDFGYVCAKFGQLQGRGEGVTQPFSIRNNSCMNKTHPNGFNRVPLDSLFFHWIPLDSIRSHRIPWVQWIPYDSDGLHRISLDPIELLDSNGLQ